MDEGGKEKHRITKRPFNIKNPSKKPAQVSVSTPRPLAEKKGGLWVKWQIRKGDKGPEISRWRSSTGSEKGTSSAITLASSRAKVQGVGSEKNA